MTPVESMICELVAEITAKLDEATSIAKAAQTSPTPEALRALSKS